MKVTLEGRLYDRRIDRNTGQEKAGKLVNQMEYVVDVEPDELGIRNAAMRQAGEDWPGWCFSVVKVGE